MDGLQEQYERDRGIWNRCANTYEKQIVGGHPDIVAFENFEENLLDSILRHLAMTQERPLKLLDIGCGSGRLHLRYGVKSLNLQDHSDVHTLVQLKKSDCDLLYDPLMERKLEEVYGIDFSNKMIRLAEQNLKQTELWGIGKPRLVLEEGSAFDLEPEPDRLFPIAVCLVNSIGVMQGEEGAMKLFDSMRRVVEAAGGVAIISCYRKEYLKSYGLNQYESTMDVSGQPRWLVPTRYATSDFLPIPHGYKRAFDHRPAIAVDIHDRQGRLVEPSVVLERDPAKTAEVLETGHIQTHWNYESHWYAFDRIEEWIRTLWGGDKTYHFESKVFDSLRARPAQLAVFDPGDALKEWRERWVEYR
jgi:SAM-dependent methyltransferase